jgi:hypothetical protein
MCLATWYRRVQSLITKYKSIKMEKLSLITGGPCTLKRLPYLHLLITAVWTLALVNGKKIKGNYFKIWLVPFKTLFSTKRLLELQEIGLIKYWDLWFRPMPRQCKETFKSGYTTPTNKHTPLSLKNLTGTFIVLLVGLTLSLLAFLSEQIVSFPERHRRQRNKLQQVA